MSKENKTLNRLVEVLENAGDKDMPPVRAVAAVAAAVTTILDRDRNKSEGNSK